MSNPVIQIENLSKRYTIRHQIGADGGLRGVLDRFATAPLRWMRQRSAGQSKGVSGPPAAHIEIFYALDGVSFDVGRGDVVGIIGRNGAGKSTLLKILSRITYPSAGRARIKGRVASLLEVGTGFHPELTGRENVFLNGSILGMRREEIKRKFDEIVTFSGVERFLDTPVKRYSSGMAVRLAFAVAAHLDPEILLVDEVLAVGDAEFQRKCLGRMKEVTKEGRTVVFVSHNMPAVRSLCPRALLLERGRLVMDGPSSRVVAAYLDNDSAPSAVVDEGELERRTAARGWGPNSTRALRCKEVRLVDSNGVARSEFDSSEEITLRVTYECLQAHSDFRLIVSVVDDDNLTILSTQNADSANGNGRATGTGVFTASCVLPANLFGERQFYVSLLLALPHVDLVRIERAIGFSVRFLGYNDVQYMSEKQVFIRPQLSWRVESQSV